MKKSVLLFLISFISIIATEAQTLVSATYLGAKSKFDISSEFFFLLPVEYGVKFYKITYSTPDVQGQPSVASGLMAVPDVKDKTFPLLCYQHGTSSSRTDVPSALNQESRLPIMFASLGYLVVTPDYLGLGDSPGFHPYVHAETEASAGADALRAVVNFADDEDYCYENRVFLTGYSQGGHASAALHRLFDETDEFNVVAGAHLSGPYSVSGVMRELLFADEPYSRPAYLINTMFSYQYVYGDLYADITDAVKPQYVDKCTQYFNGDISLSQLNDFLIAALTTNEGSAIPGRVFKDDFRALVDADPNHPVNLALARNDVMDWAPAAPTRLFYCIGDDQVPYENSVVAEAAIAALNPPDFDAIDLGNLSHTGCVTPAVYNTVTQLFQGIRGTLQACTIISGTQAPAELPFQVYPNPTSEAFVIEEFPARGELVVMDAQGRIILRQPLEEGSQTIAVNGLNAGLYCLDFRTEAGRYQTKLVVQH